MNDTDKTDREGVSLASLKISQTGHIVREQPTSDFGIDAIIEIKADGVATGRLIAIQIKSGTSYFENKTSTGTWHRVKSKHRDLWLNHSLPVLVVLCDIEKQKCYYELVDKATLVPAGLNWKIHILDEKVLERQSAKDLIDLASPVAAASDYTVIEEKDVSFAGARRISIKVVAHQGIKPLTKQKLAAVARATLVRARASTYFRDELSARALKSRAVEVVFGYIYLRDIDQESASWACKFDWVSPDLEPQFRPTAGEGEPQGDGLSIVWQNRPELAEYFDEIRSTKANFLKNIDLLIRRLPNVQKALQQVIDVGGEDTDFDDVCHQFCTLRENRFSCPLECQRLDQVMSSLSATVGNAGIWWSQRDTREKRIVDAELRKCAKEIAQLRSDIDFLRREVR